MSEGDQEVLPPIKAGEYVAPVINRRAFHCPACGVYAPQSWHQLKIWVGRSNLGTHVYQGKCFNCEGLTYWLADSAASFTFEDENATMVFPVGSARAPLPVPDFPDDARADYEEARAIVDRSPRGAVALLRLALQKLCIALGQPGKKIDDDIAALVRAGLPPRVQKALDSLRVIGNNAVHPGHMDLRDDRQTAAALFGLLNFIVEQMITRANELDGIYETLPETAREYIERRDG